MKDSQQGKTYLKIRLGTELFSAQKYLLRIHMGQTIFGLLFCTEIWLVSMLLLTYRYMPSIFKFVFDNSVNQPTCFITPLAM